MAGSRFEDYRPLWPRSSRIATSFHDRFNTPENRERMKASYALRREGTADEVADLVCFLACSESSYLTGTNIDINGGCFFS